MEHEPRYTRAQLERIEQALERRFPTIAEEVGRIHNGYDEEPTSLCDEVHSCLDGIAAGEAQMLQVTAALLTLHRIQHGLEDAIDGAQTLLELKEKAILLCVDYIRQNRSEGFSEFQEKFNALNLEVAALVMDADSLQIYKDFVRDQVEREPNTLIVSQVANGETEEYSAPQGNMQA